MSRFLDMAEFGEAARYLRLTNLEQLAAKAQAFDGTHLNILLQSWFISNQHYKCLLVLLSVYTCIYIYVCK